MVMSRRKGRDQAGRPAIGDSLNAAFGEIYTLRNVAGPDEDPNVTSAYASPPCYMHELCVDELKTGKDEKKA